MLHLPKRVLQFIADRKSISDPATDRDRRIASRLQDLFEGELAMSDLGELQFFVHKGSVVLRGAFEHPTDHQAVVDLVGSVPEVKRVVDHLAPANGVADPSTPASPRSRRSVATTERRRSHLRRPARAAA